MIRNLLFIILFPVSGLAQNVGIGITPTKARLEVSGAVGKTVAIFGGEGAGISLQANPPALGFNRYNDGGNQVLVAGTSWMKFLDMNTGSLVIDNYVFANPGAVSITSTRRLTIRQNGNVSIQGTEANSTLFVANINVGLPAAIFRGSQYNSVFYEPVQVNLPNRNTYINAGKNGSMVLLNDKLGGNLLIGDGTTKVGINTEPTDILEVKQYGGRGLALINPNFAYWEMFVEKNFEEPASDFYIYYNGGNLGNFYQGDGLYYHYSDQRVKTNIESLQAVLPGIMELRPCTYEINYNNPDHIPSLGLIAQEVRKIFPEVTDHVTGDSLGYPGLTDLYTINYDALGPLAIKAIQEQQEKIKDLQKQVAAIRQRVAAAEKAALLMKKTTSLESK